MGYTSTGPYTHLVGSWVYDKQREVVFQVRYTNDRRLYSTNPLQWGAAFGWVEHCEILDSDKHLRDFPKYPKKILFDLPCLLH